MATKQSVSNVLGTDIIDLNDQFTYDMVNLWGKRFSMTCVQIHTASDTLDVTADSGCLHLTNTTGLTFTLPATALCVNYTIAAGKDGLTITVSPNANDMIIGGPASGVDNKDIVLTNSRAGDYVKLIGDAGAATGWYVLECRGDWDAEA